MACGPKPADVTAIPLVRRLPGASSNLPERLARTDLKLALRVVPIRSCSRWGLPCRFRRRKRGALLPHRFTLTAAKTLRSRGGLFSVALSLRIGSRLRGNKSPPDVIRHRSSMEPGLSSPVAFRHWRGAAVRPTDADSNGVTWPPRQGRRLRALMRLYASGAGRVSASARSVSWVEASAMPSTRAGRKWRWNAVTTTRVASS